MSFECTLVRGPASAVQSPPEELSVGVSYGTPGKLLQDLLALARDAGNLTVGGLDLTHLTVGQPPLVDGAVIVDGGAAPAKEANTPALLLLTHAGPDAGSMFTLERGRYSMGRFACDITIPDPGISREHAALDVSATSLRFVQADGTVVVDGAAARHATLSSSSSFRCGNSAFSIHVPMSGIPALPPDAGKSVAEPIEVIRRMPNSNRRTATIAALVPLLAGVGLAALTGMWMFLGFTAISAAGLLAQAITGTRERKEFRKALLEAVSEDAGRRHGNAPSAAWIRVAASRGMDAPGAAAAPAASSLPPVALDRADSPSQQTDTGPVWLRLGIAEVRPNIRVVPDDPSFQPPGSISAPLTLDPALPAVALSGQPQHVDAMVRHLLLQLAGLPSAYGTPVVVLGTSDRLPLCARFVPGFSLATTNKTALAALLRLAQHRPGKLIVLEHAHTTHEGFQELASVASEASWQILLHSGESLDGAGAGIEIAPSGVAAWFATNGLRQPFVPDLVSEKTFDQACRRIAARGPADDLLTHNVIPAECSLSDVLPMGVRSVLRRWASVDRVLGLEASLGRDGSRPLRFDFTLDGPHLLIAGTTGSGKSELLRSIVGSLALGYPPERVVFVLIDFKGGSGLGPLSALPHCVGFFTDLASHELERALASLRGEIRYREERFAEAGAADIKGYRNSGAGTASPIPYLVVVVDEFRMLVDDAPEALSELMRIATIGRSLGIHLVMATQRPQGALTADIRANVTSSIALRVQSDAESLDVINSKAAAAIPVHHPGRAYLVRASGVPEEFQSASLNVTGTSKLNRSYGASGQGVLNASMVQPARGALDSGQEAPASPSCTVGAVDETANGVAAVLSTVRTAWEANGAIRPRQAVPPPLPTIIPWESELAPPAPGEAVAGLNGGMDQPQGIAVGLLDRPERQVIEVLRWDPLADGHLAMVGSASSGMPESFRAVFASLATQPRSPHLYILDAVGLLGLLDGEDHYGAVAGLHQLPLAVRVIERISSEMSKRRGTNRTGPAHPHLVLVVAGWCSWQSALRSSQFAWAEEIFRDIVRDGTPLGVTVLVCGERELVSSRFLAAIPNRAFFPTGSSEESRFHWPRLPATQPVRGRAVAFGAFAGGPAGISQFRFGPEASLWPPKQTGMIPAPPFRLRRLPDHLSTDDFDAAFAGRGESSTRKLWFGMGGDEAGPVFLPLKPGGTSLIIGGAGSGKSSLLSCLLVLNPTVKWIYPREGEQEGPFWTKTAAGALDPKSVLLVDDADRLDAAERVSLSNLAGRVEGIVMTATTSPALHRRLPLVEEIQAARMGLVLVPRTPTDADVFGVRLTFDSIAAPGRGVRVNGQDLTPFQAAFAGPQEP